VKSINIFKIKECTENCLKWKLGALRSRLPKEEQRKQTNKRELTIKDEMDRLDLVISNNSDVTSLDEELKKYDNLKKELQQTDMKAKVKLQSFDPNASGLKKGKDLQNIFSISKKEITVRR